jgi:hypothetical protein
MSPFWDICVLIIIIFPLLDLRKGACLRLQQPFVQYSVSSLLFPPSPQPTPSPPPLLRLILRPSFRFHFKKIFTSKQNEAKRDPFRMRSLFFVSSFSVKMKGNNKGHMFSLCFASISSIFASYFPLSLLSEKVAEFFVSYFPISLLSDKITPIFPSHFETKKQSVSLRLSFLFACFG